MSPMSSVALLLVQQFMSSSLTLGPRIASIALPTLRAGLEWDTTTLAADGTIRVKAAAPAQLLIAVTGSGTERGISISWDPIYGNHILQSQTNAIGEGITTNWQEVVNAPNPFIIQPIPTGENVFFRLILP